MHPPDVKARFRVIPDDDDNDDDDEVLSIQLMESLKVKANATSYG